MKTYNIILTGKFTGKKFLGRLGVLEYNLDKYLPIRIIGLIRLRIGITREPLSIRH